MRHGIALFGLLALGLGLTIHLGCSSGASTGGTGAGGGRISGTVAMLGSPAGGVTVTAYREAGTAGEPDAAGSAATDSTGAYAVSGLPAGTYTLYARQGEYAGGAAGVRLAEGGSAAAHLTLIPTGSIGGTVDLAGASGNGGVRVSVVGVPVAVLTDAAGSYVIPGVPMGDNYSVAATKAGCTLALQHGVSVEPGVETTTAPIVLGVAQAHPPTISTVSASPMVVATGAVTSLDCQAGDADGDTLTYAWAGGTGGAYSATDAADVTWQAPTTAGSYLLTVAVTDEAGNAAAGAVSVLVQAPGNHPPQITTVTASPAVVGPGDDAALLCSASDADGDALTYAWSAATGGGLSSATGQEVTWTAPATAGSYLLWVRVSDGAGGVVMGAVSVLVDVPANDPPVVATVTASPATVNTSTATTLGCAATDANGDTLAYAWSGGAGGVFSASTGQTVTWTAPATAGSRTITVTVTDGHGGSTAGVVAVLVVQPNRAPVITGMTPAAGTDYGPGDTTTCTVTASDADANPLTYKWTATGGSFTGSGASVTWKADQEPSTYTITCEVTDGRGGVAIASRTVTVSAVNVIVW